MYQTPEGRGLLRMLLAGSLRRDAALVEAHLVVDSIVRCAAIVEVETDDTVCRRPSLPPTTSPGWDLAEVPRG